MIKFIDSFIEPDPKECTYWIDLNADQNKSVIKYYNGSKWTPINKTEQLDVINNVTSTDKTKALSALQGKILNDTINALLKRIQVLENTLNKKAIVSKVSKNK